MWLRSKDKLDHDETIFISEHLKTCHLCKERLDTLHAYYTDLEREINQDPGKKERDTTSKIFQRRTRKALSSGSLMQTYEAPLEEHRSSLPVRVKNYLQQHPVGSVSLTVGALFLATILFVVQPWKNMDDNPIYAEVERNVLHVYNQEGEDIWNMVVDGIPNGTTSEIGTSTSIDRFIRITDIDGDGTNEVLLSGEGYSGEYTADVLYCYNSDGTIRWKQSPPPPISFGTISHSGSLNWNIEDFFSLNTSENTARLFVASNSSWFPSVLIELNPSDGEILQSYWHPGWIFRIEVYETGESENTRIILGATNNTYQKAALIVLSPGNINGHSPLKESYQPETLSRANEDHYILFKPSLLNELVGKQLYNQTYWLRFTDGGELMARARENIQVAEEDYVSVMYILDKNFKVVEARGDAAYQRIYSDLYNEGELQELLTDEFWESLKDSVLYWNEAAERFISHGELTE